MNPLKPAALAGFLIAGGCALSVADAPPQSAAPGNTNARVMFEVTAAEPTPLFSRSGHAKADEADNRAMPLFQVCSPSSSPAPVDIWLFPAQGSVSGQHPSVKHVSVDAGGCIFVSGGYIEARLASAAGPATAWLEVTPVEQ